MPTLKDPWIALRVSGVGHDTEIAAFLFKLDNNLMNKILMRKEGVEELPASNDITEVRWLDSVGYWLNDYEFINSEAVKQYTIYTTADGLCLVLPPELGDPNEELELDLARVEIEEMRLDSEGVQFECVQKHTDAPVRTETLAWHHIDQWQRGGIEVKGWEHEPAAGW